jgi:site-specific DNA-methyltransferase (adenine-specific)
MELYEGDAIDCLDSVRNKSVQTIIIDPPYNIGKDTWDTIDNYSEWLLSIVLKLEQKLKDNGSFFMFHNDMEQICELMTLIKKRTKFKFRQMIVWNKRFNESKKKGYLDGYVMRTQSHNWEKMAEYVLFYTFDNHHKLKEARERLGVKQTTISSEILSKSGGMTGWYSNLETGKNLPTHETIVPITKHLGITFDDIVPKFKNQKTHHSVWNYDMAPRNKVHITPKPLELLETLLMHTTDEDDLVLDCFAGSGSLGAACKKLKRKCILIEKDPKYCEFIRTALQCP